MGSARILAVLLSFALVGAACGGGDDGEAAVDGATGSSLGSAAPSVWPLPPDGEVVVLEPYAQSDDGVTFRAAATFGVAGLGIEDAMEFYEQYFAEIGVLTGAFAAGQSAVLDLTYPDDPNVVAVVEITGTSEGITIRQEKAALSGSRAADTPSSETVSEPESTSTVGSAPVDPPATVAPAPASSDGGDMAGDEAQSDNAETADNTDEGDTGEGNLNEGGGGTAMLMEGGVATIDWPAANPTYVPAQVGVPDPFFHIHSSNELDGFYLSFEMYTVWGEAWTGEVGTFDISCVDPRTDTGICVHFDPDGPGPSPDLGEDFGARGKVVIRRLDAGGYDFDVTGLTFSDGTFFNDFTMQG